MERLVSGHGFIRAVTASGKSEPASAAVITRSDRPSTRWLERPLAVIEQVNECNGDVSSKITGNLLS
jgi:hypothetical protein